MNDRSKLARSCLITKSGIAQQLQDYTWGSAGAGDSDGGGRYLSYSKLGVGQKNLFSLHDSSTGPYCHQE